MPEDVKVRGHPVYIIGILFSVVFACRRTRYTQVVAVVVCCFFFITHASMNYHEVKGNPGKTEKCVTKSKTKISHLMETLSVLQEQEVQRYPAPVKPRRPLRQP